MKHTPFLRSFILICLTIFSHWAIGQSDKPLSKEVQDSLKNLTPVPGKAIVYIVRPTIYGFAVPMRLDCDSFQVGWINAKTFLYTILDSGEHEFKALAENEVHMKMNLESGKVYFLQQEVKMGWLYARTKFKVLADQEGAKYLAKCNLSKYNRYPHFPNSKDVEKSPPKEDH